MKPADQALQEDWRIAKLGEAAVERVSIDSLVRPACWECAGRRRTGWRMSFVQRTDTVEALAPARVDDALGARILPGRD